MIMTTVWWIRKTTLPVIVIKKFVMLLLVCSSGYGLILLSVTTAPLKCKFKRDHWESVHPGVIGGTVLTRQILKMFLDGVRTTKEHVLWYHLCIEISIQQYFYIEISIFIQYFYWIWSWKIQVYVCEVGRK